MDGAIAHVEYRFKARPETVFDAFLDPDLISQWMFAPSLRGETPVRIEIDAGVGGAFSFEVEANGRRRSFVGVYREIERPTQLVFTWRDQTHDQDTLVTVTFRPEGEGCHVILTHNLGRVDENITRRAEKEWAAEFDVMSKVIN